MYFSFSLSALLCVYFLCGVLLLFFFKQKTAYEMRISDWSSDVCSSDLGGTGHGRIGRIAQREVDRAEAACERERRQLIRPQRERDGTGGSGGFSFALLRRHLRTHRQDENALQRSEERPVGKECGSKCRSRCLPDH